MWVRSRLLVLLYSSVFRSHSKCLFFLFMFWSSNVVSWYVPTGTAACKANPHVYTATNYSSRIFRLSDDMSDIERERNYPILWYDEVSSTMDKVIVATTASSSRTSVADMTLVSLYRHAICAHCVEMLSLPLLQDHRRTPEERAAGTGSPPRATCSSLCLSNAVPFLSPSPCCLCE